MLTWMLLAQMMMGHPDGTSMHVHMQALRQMPRELQGVRNPLEPTPEHITEGGHLYRQYCASCHGPQGQGNEPAAAGLVPPPPALRRTVRMPMVSDGYLYWRIREGGQRFRTAMPAFGNVLSKDAIWKIILYMRAGFPDLRPLSPEDPR